MCDQFKKDFINKTVQILDNDVMHSLETHYNVIVKPCYYRNAQLGCKQFFVKVNDTFKKGVLCTKCNRSICEICTASKSLDNGQCVDCYFLEKKRSDADFLKKFRCKFCKATDIYSYGHLSYVYCNIGFARLLFKLTNLRVCAELKVGCFCKLFLKS